MNLDWLHIDVLHFQYFLLIFARIASMVAFSPVIGSGAVPPTAKIGLSFLLSIIVYPFTAANFPPIPDNTVLFFMMLIREVMVGVLVGTVAVAIFAGVQLSGQIFGMQVGFGIVNVIDPMSETQVSILGQFEFLIALLLFVTVDGHHLVLLAIANSYKYLPVDTFHITENLAFEVAGLLQKMFVVAFKVGIPMIATLLTVTVTMGLIARTVPQMNVFIVGLPLNILTGLFMLGMSLALLAYILRGYFDEMFRHLIVLFRIAGGT